MAQCQGPRAQLIRLFWSLPIFSRKILRKFPICQGPRPKTWLVGVTIFSTIFQLEQFPSTLPVFMRQITLKKKLARGNVR